MIGRHGPLHLRRLQQAENNENGDEEEEGNGSLEVGYSQFDKGGNLNLQNYLRNPEFVWIGCRRVELVYGEHWNDSFWTAIHSPFRLYIFGTGKLWSMMTASSRLWSAL